MQLVKATRDALLRPLQVVSGIVERRQTLPILANILVRKDGENVAFTATDLELQIRTSAAIGAAKDAAATTGCYMEVNAQPDRLDLNDVHCRLAK